MLPFAPRAGGPPLTPDSPEAREWLERELAKPEYQAEQGLLDRIIEWVLRQLDGGPTGALPGPVLWLLLAVVVVGIILVVARSLRSNPGDRSADAGEVFGDGRLRTATQHRQAARAAMADGDHDLAVLEAFRGMARDGADRTLLPDSPGMTVQEVLVGLTRAFPTKGDPLASSAAAFDDVRYGDARASAATATSVVALGEELAGETPVLPDLPSVAGSSPGALP